MIRPISLKSISKFFSKQTRALSVKMLRNIIYLLILSDPVPVRHETLCKCWAKFVQCLRCWPNINSPFCWSSYICQVGWATYGSMINEFIMVGPSWNQIWPSVLCQVPNRYYPKDVLMLAQRLRRWTSNSTTLAQHLRFGRDKIMQVVTSQAHCDQSEGLTVNQSFVLESVKKRPHYSVRSQSQ